LARVVGGGALSPTRDGNFLGLLLGWQGRAIGDVRSGSVKRVAAAVGEDAQVVAALHAFLALSGQAASKSPPLYKPTIGRPSFEKF
jgi:hypothetical protein